MENNTQKQKRSSFDRWFVNSALVLMLLGLFTFAYFAFAPLHIIDIKSSNVETAAVKPGGTLIFDFNYCKYKNIDGLVYRYIKNESTNAEINLPVVATVSYPGCHVARVYVELPQGIPDGKYTLYGNNVYRINGIRTAQSPFKTNEFMIQN